MSSAWRGTLNRWRRRVAHALLHRVVFGETSGGRYLPNTRIAPSTCIEHEDRLQLADHVFIGAFNFIEASGGVTVGEGVQITHHVGIVTHSSHRAQRLLGRAYADWPASATEPRPGWIDGPVHIGAYCFIGPQVLIEAGTRLGRGCIVSAGSVLRHGRHPRLRASRAAALSASAWFGAIIDRQSPDCLTTAPRCAPARHAASLAACRPSTRPARRR